MAQAQSEHLPFTLWQLQVFARVADRGGYSAAARELHISQPAASGLVTQLERTVGLPLMKRQGRHVRLTAEGRLVYEHAQRITAGAGELQSLVQQMGQLERGRLSIGTGAMIAANYLVAIVAGFRREHPGVEISLGVENRQRLVEGLTDGRHDVVVTSGQLEGAESTLFMPDELLIVGSPQHELAGERGIPVSALSRAPVLLRERGSHARQAFDQILADQDAKLESFIEIADNEAIKRAVVSDLGVALLSRGTVQRELDAGTMVELDVQGLPVPFAFSVFWVDRGRGLLDQFTAYMLSRRPAADTARRVAARPARNRAKRAPRAQ